MHREFSKSCVVSLFNVPSLVLVEIGRVTELSRAFLAFERTISSMNPNVYLQTARTKERLGACLTTIFALTSVLQQMGF